MSVYRLFGDCFGPRLYKIHVRTRCSETGGRTASCSTATSKTALYSLPPVGSHYWVSIGKARLFSLPSLALWWEKLSLRWIQRLCPGGGGIMLYTIQSLLHRCCGLPSLNWGGLAFSRLEKLLARQRHLHLPESLDKNGKRECMCRLCVHVCQRAKLNYNLTFLSSDSCSLKRRLI